MFKKLISFIPPLFILFVLVNAQNYSYNYTVPFIDCNVYCPKTLKWYDYLNPNNLVSSIVGWLTKSIKLNLSELTIGLISFLIIAIILWGILKISKTIVFIIIILLVIAIILTSIFGIMGFVK